MSERMELGFDPLPDDLDRLVSITLFFEAAALAEIVNRAAFVSVAG